MDVVVDRTTPPVTLFAANTNAPDLPELARKSDPYPPLIRPSSFFTAFLHFYWSVLEFSTPFLHFHYFTSILRSSRFSGVRLSSASTPTSPTRRRSAIAVSLSLSSLSRVHSSQRHSFNAAFASPTSVHRRFPICPPATFNFGPNCIPNRIATLKDHACEITGELVLVSLRFTFHHIHATYDRGPNSRGYQMERKRTTNADAVITWGADQDAIMKGNPLFFILV
ncbi:hypothetical protein LXL04_029702 [Taraxacum kok-saghyz]